MLDFWAGIDYTDSTAKEVTRGFCFSAYASQLNSNCGQSPRVVSPRTSLAGV